MISPHTTKIRLCVLGRKKLLCTWYLKICLLVLAPWICSCTASKDGGLVTLWRWVDGEDEFVAR